MDHPRWHEPEFFLLGASCEARAVLDHLEAEAPDLLGKVVLVDASPGPAVALRRRGVRVVLGDPWEVTTLVEAGARLFTGAVELEAAEGSPRP